MRVSLLAAVDLFFAGLYTSSLSRSVLSLSLAFSLCVCASLSFSLCFVFPCDGRLQCDGAKIRLWALLLSRSLLAFRSRSCVSGDAE